MPLGFLPCGTFGILDVTGAKELSVRKVCVILFSVLFPSVAISEGISNADLYRTRAFNCRSVELAGWQHPVKPLLIQADVQVLSVDICNGGTYPIFRIRPRYDPRLAATDSFFLKFYRNLAVANSWWSYALIDDVDKVIIYIDLDRRKQIFVKIGLEEYDSEGGGK